MSEPLLRFDCVSKVYGAGETEVFALNGVDFRVTEGEFVAVMGPSGSGKSTAMNILGCLDTPTAGRYLFQGVDVGTLDRNQRGLLRRHYLGFVFQGFNLLRRTSALDNVALPLVYRGVPINERRALAREALARVGLTGRETHNSNELSGGQQQRVAIARALVSNPQLLLADEPTGNLDSQRSQEVMTLLRQLNHEAGITIVLITHDAEMARNASRRIVFRDGRIVEDSRLAAA